MSAMESRVPAADYHSRPGISISKLKEMKRSPLHYRYRLEHPKTSEAMTLGTAAHCAVLEPERFDSEFAVWERRTEAGKMAPRSGQHWLNFCAENIGHTIITADEFDDAMAIQKAVHGDAVAMKYLAAGEPEVSMEWDLNGLACRGRVDWLTYLDDEPCVVGIKTARDCRPFIFASAAAKLGYGMQWSWYSRGYSIIKNRVPRMVEIVVESAPPHAVVTFVIPEDVILRGREEYEELLVMLDRCEREKLWPGPAETEQILSMPTWWYGGTLDDLTEVGLEL